MDKIHPTGCSKWCLPQACKNAPRSAKPGPAATVDYNLPPFQANLLHNNARVSVWQRNELFESDNPRDVTQIGVGQTFYFVFQQKWKVNLIQVAQRFDGNHASTCPGNTPAQKMHDKVGRIFATNSCSFRPACSTHLSTPDDAPPCPNLMLPIASWQSSGDRYFSVNS